MRQRARDGWSQFEIDDRAGTVTRPPGVRLDSGGLGKGLAADLVAPVLERLPSFLVDCGGDLRTGGQRGLPRPIEVADPWGGEPVHRLTLTSGAVATSGTTRRTWADGDAHHLLDPATGRPADTGVVQATAIAPTALEAEVLAKAALLAGPECGPAWLCHGGVLVTGDGAVHTFDPVEEIAFA